MIKRIREIYADVNSEFAEMIAHDKMVVISQHLEQVHFHLLKRLSRYR